MNSMKTKIVTAFVLAVALSPLPARADQNSEQPAQSPALFDTVWQAPQLYSNKNNLYIQTFDLVGRYHGQYWWADSNGTSENEWENRRMYVGFNSRIFNNFTVEVQVNLNDDFDPVYKALYDAFIKWQPSENNFSLSVGRLDYVYTGMERSTSSKRIKTIERALLVGQVMPGEVVGGYIKGTRGDFSYQTGLFSGSIEDEFTDFSGGFAALLGMSLKLPLFLDSGTLHLDYLYNNGDQENTAFKPYSNVLSIWHEGHTGSFGFGIDITGATGVDDSSDVFGITLLPTYDLTGSLLIENDKLQLTGRYHYASSSDDFGLNFNKRYEQEVTSGAGDAYNSFYLGLNYYIYQQKLKCMAGVEYFTMNDVADIHDEEFAGMTDTVDGWIVSSGIRLYF